VIPHFFLKWQIVELAAESELFVDFFLGDVEVLDVKETLGMLLGQEQEKHGD